jgi:hypothetical protein
MQSARQIAPWLIRKDTSSGTSTASRFAICSGLHAVTHARSAASVVPLPSVVTTERIASHSES